MSKHTLHLLSDSFPKIAPEIRSHPVTKISQISQKMTQKCGLKVPGCFFLARWSGKEFPRGVCKVCFRYIRRALTIKIMFEKLIRFKNTMLLQRVLLETWNI